MFYKYHNNKDFAAKQSPDSKLNYLKDVKNKLEEFQYDTIGIKPNNEDQIGLVSEKAYEFI